MARLIAFLNGEPVGELSKLDPSREYWIGRQQGCDLLISGSNISRRHLKLSFEGGRWILTGASQFARFESGTTSDKSAELLPDVEVRVSGFAFRIEGVDPDEATKATAPPKAQGALEISDTSREKSISLEIQPRAFPQSSVSDDEKTRIAPKNFQASLRFRTSNGKEMVVRLPKKSLVIGRAPECQVVLDEPKASRRHLKISFENGRYFAIDLGSSNGTLHNDRPLREDVPVGLESGDELTIGGTRAYFEMRDPEFEARLFQAPVPSSGRSRGELVQRNTNYSVIARPPNKSFVQKIADPRTIEGKIFLGLAALLVVYGLVKPDQSNETNIGIGSRGLAEGGDNATLPGSNLSQLTPEQKILIENTYRLARQYYAESRWESALIEFKKLHQIVPEYQDSKELLSHCERAMEIHAQQQEIERRKKEAREMRDKVETIVQKCETRISQGISLLDLETCLSPAVELDPENKTAKLLIQKVTEQQMNRERSQQRQRQTQALVRSTLDLLVKAQEADNRHDYKAATQMYQSVISSGAPIPQEAREKAKVRLTESKQKLEAELKNLLAQSDQAMTQTDFRTAIDKARQALRQDSENAKAKDIIGRANNELYKKLKGIYGDSVLEENLGNIEAAKQKWKTILQQDVENGEYYLKARSKLKKYGEIREVTE